MIGFPTPRLPPPSALKTQLSRLTSSAPPPHWRPAVRSETFRLGYSQVARARVSSCEVAPVARGLLVIT
jgi:hypothetical protein